MTKNHFILAFALIVQFAAIGQELRLKKGVIIDSIIVNDSLNESFALFIPQQFEQAKKWPILVVVDEKGRGRQAVSMFVDQAAKQGYILAASNTNSDTLSLTKSMMNLGRMMATINRLLPLNRQRVYTAGFNSGARLANVAPLLFKEISGVISCGATLSNVDLLRKNPAFHFIGIVGNEDFTYPELLETEEQLNKFKLANNILVFDGGKEWPAPGYLSKAMHYLTLRAMARGASARDERYIDSIYNKGISNVNALISTKNPLRAFRELKEMQNIFKDLRSIDSVKTLQKSLRKSSLYRNKKREFESARFKEIFLKEDYQFALEEDLATFNYNNLGWWNYQMDELEKFTKSPSESRQNMGKRLKGFVNALVDDNLDLEKAQEVVDDEAIIFLSMLKTITDPDDFDHYLTVISLSAKYEDFGTSIFYLEEALKNGFTDKEKLYDLEHTALLRITPEYNKVIAKYLDDPRYEIIDE